MFPFFFFFFWAWHISNNFYVQRVRIRKDHWVVIEGRREGKRKFLICP